MTRKVELEAIIRKAQQELGEIRDREILVQHAPLVGCCYKQRTSYGCPNSPDDYWWFYFKVIGLNGPRFTVFYFDKDINGKITVDPECDWGRIDELKITRAKFTEKWQEIQTEIANL